MESRTLGLLAVCLLAAVPVSAMPMRYSFTTGPFTFSSGSAPMFDSDSFVSGEINYDAAAPLTASVSGGIFVHHFGAGDLAAAVQGFNITDPVGGAVVGDEQTLTIPPGLLAADLLVLNAEPNLLPPDLIGFDLSGYRLVNVRLFWIEGLFGAPDFLSSSMLPATLPSFAGRLALDFVPLTGGSVGNAFFDGLRVERLVVRTPEPGSLALLGLALAGLGLSRRRKA